MTTVIDSSGLLARLKGEQGSEIVEEALLDGAHCSAVNWSDALLTYEQMAELQR